MWVREVGSRWAPLHNQSQGHLTRETLYKAESPQGYNPSSNTRHPMTKGFFLRFLLEQWARPVPLVTQDLTGKVVLVTGANIGLGFEAAKYFASMNPERLIIACRSEAKGNQAVKGIFHLLIR